MKERYSRREFIRNASLAGAGLALPVQLHAGGLAQSLPQTGRDDLWDSFQQPPEDARIMMRWWWFGPAVTHAELERELHAMKEAGIGGVEVQPVYPLALDDPARGIRILPYLSEDFIEALRFAHFKAREFGLRFDLTLGSGWPFGGSAVLITQSAGTLRVVRVSVAPGEESVAAPSLEAGETLLGAWAVPAGAIELEKASPLAEIHDGRVALGDSRGTQSVVFFIAGRTGMQVKRAAVGAEGFVLDHYDQVSVASYLRSTGDRLMQAFGSEPPYAVFCDSLEVYDSNWTPNLLEEFERRRGYDLKPRLPALVGDAEAASAAVRCDWGRTLSELADENFLTPMREWAHEKGTLFRAQVYGEPPVTISSNRLVDLIEGEGAGWRGFSTARWASSASHLYGRGITSAETWTWIHSPAFCATPLDLKAEADRHFLQGINQIVGHGWPYSPPGAGEPGWRFYAAGALNDHNPWWPVMSELALYLQRVSFLLRQGKPANDVAVYLSNPDAWATFKSGESPSVNQTLAQNLAPDLFTSILDAGFNFDFMDDGAIGRCGSYSAVVLPMVERIPLAVYQKFQAFAQAGGVLIATGRKPALASGLLDEKCEGDQIRALTHELFEAAGAKGIFVEDAADLGAALAARLTPDVQTSPASPAVGFIRRKLAGRELYFLANAGNLSESVQVTFRVKGLAPERWDPFSGRKLPLAWKSAPDGRIQVPLSLAPYESAVILFSPGPNASGAENSNSKPTSAPVDLSRGWNVSFPALNRAIQMDHLHPWNDDAALRRFSGRAVYEKNISVPAAMLARGARVFLNFGEGTPVEPQPLQHGTRAWLDSPVREAAMVYVNGRDVGSVWRPPFELEVTPWLRAGANELRIEAANLAINEMAGKPFPSHRLLDLRYGVRATPQDMENLAPLPSGLLGPITLIAR